MIDKYTVVYKVPKKQKLKNSKCASVADTTISNPKALTTLFITDEFKATPSITTITTITVAIKIINDIATTHVGMIKIMTVRQKGLKSTHDETDRMSSADGISRTPKDVEKALVRTTLDGAHCHSIQLTDAFVNGQIALSRSSITSLIRVSVDAD